MWYFDAWAVLDGLAFVSDRTKDQMSAASTVFLSVPDLEPVPVGRISTAMRATRAGFQDGFRDREGDEIGFESMDQIRDAIRRGYLGGGIGPATAAPPPPEEPSPEGDEPRFERRDGPPFSGGEFYELRLEQLGRQGNAWRDYSQLCYPSSRNTLLQTMSSGSEATALRPYLLAFAEATLVEYAYRNRFTLHRAERISILVRWAAFLYSLGIWIDPGDFASSLVDAEIDGPIRDILRESIYFLPYSWAQWSERSHPVAVEPLLFRLPCPLRRHWSHKIERLSDKLLLPLVDREYFSGNPELPEFIPLLLCAMAIVTDQPLIHWRDPRGRNADLRRLFTRAFRWISREMPRVELPPAAESLLSDYAWQRLEG